MPGVRLGPRVYATGYLMEWQRVYYKMGIAHLEPGASRDGAAARARCCSTTCSRATSACPICSRSAWSSSRTSIGMPVATHEIYPGGVRRRRRHRAHRGHQPPRLLAEAWHAAAQLRGRHRSSSAERGTIFCPMISGPRHCGGCSPTTRRCEQDPRFALYPGVDARAGAAQPARRPRPPRRSDGGGSGQDGDGRPAAPARASSPAPTRRTASTCTAS